MDLNGNMQNMIFQQGMNNMHEASNQMRMNNQSQLSPMLMGNQSQVCQIINNNQPQINPLLNQANMLNPQ